MKASPIIPMKPKTGRQSNRAAIPAAVVLMISAALAPLHARTWTSSDGRALEAEFVSTSGNTLTLKLSNTGRMVTLPLERLSAPDQEWVKEHAAKQGAGSSSAKPIEGPFAKLITGEWALSEHKGLPFALYAAKDLDGARKVPLVLALHGKSDNNTNGNQLGGWMKSFAKPDNYTARPCIIVAPLCYQPHGATGSGWSATPGDQTVDLVNAMIKSLPVDENRIYIIGYSMGGFGVCHLLDKEPRMFAAGVAVAGCGGAPDAFKRKPLWLFHAADDKVVNVQPSRDFAEQLKRSKTFKFTEYPDGGHGIPDRVFNTPEVHTWLFSQARK